MYIHVYTYVIQMDKCVFKYIFCKVYVTALLLTHSSVTVAFPLISALLFVTTNSDFSKDIQSCYIP